MEKESSDYKENSISLWGAISLGTGVMIGAGIFALTGQIAQLSGGMFPLAFVCAFIIAMFSAYSYVKMSNKYPSAGGIGMYLQKEYGNGVVTAGCALLMYFSMVINESLVARTFGTYTLQAFDIGEDSFMVPALGVGLLVVAFFINILSNKFIQSFQFIMSFVKILGLLVLALGGLYVAGIDFSTITQAPKSEEISNPIVGFLGATALGILAFKGFTTINNTGSEIKQPHKNVGRAILISISLCFVLYMLVAFAVGGNLSIEEIIQARDYSLAEASKPAFGQVGVYITVGFAIVATVSGVIASVFAVSRMLAMLADMNLVPYSDFGIKGDKQKHTLIYTIVFAIILTIFFDLSRIATLGAIFYILMDIAIHYGILKHMKDDLDANPVILIIAIILDLIVLGALVWVKINTDMMVVYASLIGLVVIFAGEYFYLKNKNLKEENND